jgi:hypothetical protein
VKPCCIDNALMLQVVQEYMQLSHKQLQVLKNQVSVEVDKQVLGNLNLRTERSYKEHGYLLIFYLSSRACTAGTVRT